MSQPVVLILETGSPGPDVESARGDFAAWFRAKLGLDAAQAPSIAPPRGDELPAPGSVPAVIVTGSPAYVTAREPWSVASGAWLRDVIAAGRPVLGVCYGHQLLADALGGEVGVCAAGYEFGSVRVDVAAEGRDDPLFRGLADVIDTHAAHRESVLRLPDGARRIAHNAHDPNQAFALGDRVWGVQFHPEFDGDIIRRYATSRADALRKDGLDPEAIAATARDSSDGERILRNFVGLLAP